MKFLIQVLTGMVAGIIFGLFFGAEHLNFINKWIAPFGTIFLRLLRVMVIPLVVSSLIVGVTGLGDIKKFGRIGGKTFGLYVFTTIFAVSLGIGVGEIFKPGLGITLQTMEPVVIKEIPSFSEMIIDIFPSNPIQSMMSENMLQLIIFSIAIGIGVLACGEKIQLIPELAGQIAKICYKIVGGIMKAAPVGVFCLITPVAATNGADVLMPLIGVLSCYYGAVFLHWTFVYGGLLKFVARVNPFKFFKKVSPVTLFAISSCSSSATLPVTMTYCRWMNISKEIASFVLPLGATINMDGTAIHQGLCAVFAAQVCGIELSALHYVYIALFGTLFSIGAAGIPGGGIVALSILFTALGLPMDALALMIGIDRIIELGSTAMNVTGDTVVCGVIAKSEGETLNI